MWLPKEIISNRNLLGEIPMLLDDYTAMEKKDGIKSVKGSLRNYKVGIYEQGVSLKGSIAKFMNGNNFNTLNTATIKEAVEKMSDKIHLPINKASVTGIHIAHNFTMQHTPEQYYPYLGECRYYERDIFRQSLYYENDVRTLNFYNKIAESGKNNVPVIFKNSNILRYELRFKKRLQRQFNMERVDVQLLAQETFYNSLITRYMKEYKAISKHRDIKRSSPAYMNPKDIITMIGLEGVKSIGGQKAVFDLIEKLKFKRPEYKSRAKAIIKRLCNNNDFTNESDLIAELDKMVKAVRQFQS